ncbi:MAG TPA: HD domain-containing protein [Woeseiaceae bacterium]|nr:HD domain-containing protein [Woeseiaceae bacterium]
MDRSELPALLDFLRGAEQLKNTIRHCYTSEGRRESVAEHTWRLCLMALVFEKYFADIDFARLVKICVIHDLGEAIGGDIPAPAQVGRPAKAAQERRDLMQLLAPLPDVLRDDIAQLWDEYEQATTAEARVAKGLDKLETILQHIQGQNPEDFDYRFNLHYGRNHTAGEPLIAALRELLDEETERRARAADAAQI